MSDRDYVEPPLKVEIGRDKDEEALEAKATEEQPEVEETGEAPESERDRIARKYAEKMEADIEARSEEEQPQMGIVDTETPEPEAEPEPDPEPEPELVAVKIDGETRMVESSVIEDAGGVRAYQKEQAADKRFRELAEEQRAFQEQVRQFQAQQAPAPQAEITEPPQEDAPDRDTLARKALQAMYDGDEDEAAQHLIALTRQDAAQPAIKPEDVINKAAQVMAQNQYQRDVAEGKEDFINDYPEIAKKPELWTKASELTKTIAREHPAWRPQRVMKEAGKRVRKDEKAKAAAAQGTREEKIAAKKAQTNVGVSTGRGTPPPPPQHQSDADYVKSLQVKRGLVNA